MKTSKLTVSFMFLATMAWAGVAQAEEPCGAPARSFNNCHIVQAPSSCDDACNPSLMVQACTTVSAAECVDQCSNVDASGCDSSCAMECSGTCEAEPQAYIGGGGDCEIYCGSSCMSDCSAGCIDEYDKTLCYSSCNSQCDAHCEISCEDDYDDDYDDDYYEDDYDDDYYEDDDCYDYCYDYDDDYYDDFDDCYDDCYYEDDYDDDYSDDYDDDYSDDYDDDYSDDYDDCFYDDCYEDDYDDDYSDDYDDYHGRSGNKFGIFLPPGHGGFPPGQVKKGRFHYYSVQETANDLAAPVCEDTCQQACAGSCAANVARDCEQDCQAERAVDCQANMAASCVDSCSAGASILVCDGQYVQAPDVGACVAELEREGVEVEGSSGLERIDVPTAALPTQTASCSVEDPKRMRFAGALFTLLGFGFGANLLRRRRRS